MKADEPTAVGTVVALPAEGEALLTAKTCAAVLEISESTWWAWVAEPDFPIQPVRRGERWTRFRLSEVRDWMTALTAGDPKESPSQRKRSKAGQVPSVTDGRATV